MNNKPTDKQMLEVIIQRAIDGGWDMFGVVSHGEKYDGYSWEIDAALHLKTDRNFAWSEARYSISDIFFNSDFGEAYWGEEEETRYYDTKCRYEFFQHWTLDVMTETARIKYVYDSWEK